jgi:hypothetical protein
MTDTMSENAKQFITANRRSPVVAGSAIGQGGEGCHYTLKNGRGFTLTREECEQVGHPRWDSSETSNGYAYRAMTDTLVERLDELRTILATDEYGDRYWARQELAGSLPRIITTLKAQASRIAELEGENARLREAGGAATCEMCDSPDTCPAEDCAFKFNALSEIGNNIAYWLRYARENRSGMAVTPDTHIIPPYWPSYGQLCNWLDYLNPEKADEARKALSHSSETSNG